MNPTRCLCALLLSLVALCVLPERTLAWELFRSENADVKRGNELLQQGKAEEATQAFDAAQRALPGNAGVELNRGLGLMASGKLSDAREAFRASVQSAPTPELRSKANYNLGLSFLREADAAAQAEDLSQAQKFLNESVDAFKNALRNGPKNRDAAWNLELAKRRLVDLEAKKQEQQDKKDQQDKQDQDNSEENKDQQDKQDQDPNQENSSSEDGADPSDKSDEPGKPDQPEDKKPDGDKDQDPQEKSGQPDKPPADEKPQDGKASDAPSQPESAPEPNALPEHMQRALDALSESDDNLQKQRARARARQRPQRIEKDW